MTNPWHPTQEQIEAVARAIAKSQGCVWEAMCIAEPFPPHWSGTLITHEDCRRDAVFADVVSA